MYICPNLLVCVRVRERNRNGEEETERERNRHREKGRERQRERNGFIPLHKTSSLDTAKDTELDKSVVLWR